MGFGLLRVDGWSLRTSMLVSPEVCFSVGVLWLCKLKTKIFQQLMTSFASNGQNKNIPSEFGLCKHVADCSQGTQGVNNAVNIFFPYGLLW